VKNKYRVILTLDLLHKAFAVEVDISLVERIHTEARQKLLYVEQSDARGILIN
jgi:hypothetical protein